MALAGALLATPAPAADQTTFPQRVDAAHRSVSRKIVASAAGIDHLLWRTFGGGPADTNANGDANGATAMSEGNGGSRVTITPTLAYSERDGFEYRGRFFARLDLPRFEDRVQVIVNNIQDDEDVLREFTDPISSARRVEGENDKSAGVRFVLVERMGFDMAAGAGLRFDGLEPVPKLRLRARLSYTADRWRYELTETGFWQSDDGFGQKTELSVAHALTPRLTVRNTGALLIREEEDGVELGDTLSLRYHLAQRRTIGLKLGAQWRTEPSAAVENYSVRLPFRQGFWRQWLYFQLEPGADFPNEDDYDVAPLISAGFEVTFGDPMPARRVH